MKILEVKNLEKSFSKKLIVKNISFDIKEGEIVGFVGPNGAGKTTTLKLITNLIFPDKGQVKINNFNLFKQREKALASLAAIIETPGLYTYLSGRDNMEYIRKLRNVSKDKMNSIIKEIGLDSRIEDKVKKYSLGMKQRLALGMCLMCEPKLLILDEPTNGLDPSGTQELRELIVSLAKEKHIAVLFSSHLLGEVERICDKIVFIKDGQIVSEKKNNKILDISKYKITFENVDIALELVKDSPYILSTSKINENELLIDIENNSISELLKLFSVNNIRFLDIEKRTSMIEDDYNSIFKENKDI